MALDSISPLFSKSPFAFQPGDRYALSLPTLASDALALAQTGLEAKAQKKRLVVICADAADVYRLSQEISWFAPNLSVSSLPDWETLPYDVLSPQEDLVSERLATLYRLSTERSEGDVVLVSAVTASQRFAPVSFVGGNTFFFRTGDTVSLTSLKSNLVKAGYANVKEVLAAGEFAVRGEIVDVFPMGTDRPFRLDFFDDEIESIRWFDVETQRSMEKVDEIRLLPGHEFPVNEEALTAFRQRWRVRFPGDPSKFLPYKDAGNGILSPGIEYYQPLFFDETATFADYLTPETRVVFVGDIQKALEGFLRETTQRARILASDPLRPALEPKELWLTPEDFFTSLAPFARFTIRRVEQGSAKDLQCVAIDRKSQIPV